MFTNLAVKSNQLPFLPRSLFNVIPKDKMIRYLSHEEKIFTNLAVMSSLPRRIFKVKPEDKINE